MPRYEVALRVYGYREYHAMLHPTEVANRIINNSGRSLEDGNNPSIMMQPAHNNLGTEDADVLNNVVLSSFTPVGEHPREEILVAMLGSHPWTAADAAAINIVNEHGQSLAHLCAQLGHNKLLLAVIEWGIDIRAKDVNGWTPLDFARLHGDEEAADILEGDWVDTVDCEGTSQLPDVRHAPVSLATGVLSVASFVLLVASGTMAVVDKTVKSCDIKSTMPSPSLADKLATPLIPFRSSSTPGKESLGAASKGYSSVSACIEL